MIKNFTHLKLSESNSRRMRRIMEKNDSQQSNPSDSVIRNLLNYSKALTVLSDKHSGNVHLVLLN